jgi:hypothetical protein
MSVVGLAAAGWLAMAAPAAQAWVRTAQAAGDPQTTWVVSATTITIRSTDPVFLSFVRGSHVLLGCNSSQQVAAHRPPPIVFWPPTASSITARVRDRIGRHVTVCNAVEVGRVPGFPMATQFSVAPFDSASRKEFAGTPPPGRLLARAQLSEYWGAVEAVVGPAFLNRLGILVGLPRARVVARELKLSYVPTLSGITVPHVAYVVGQGSGPKRLELAVIGFDGKLYVLHAQPDRPPRFGSG